MRKFYLLVCLLSCATFSFAQTIQLSPLDGNAILQKIGGERELKEAYQVEKLTGFNPLLGPMPESLDDCTDDYGFPLVEEGGEIFLTIDTIGLGGGTFGDSLVIDTACGLEFSDEVFITGATIEYNAALFMDNADLKEDTVCVTFFQNQGDTIPIRIPVSIRRKGRNIVAPTEMIQTNSTAVFCIEESAIELPTQIQCGEIKDVLDDGYDGNGVIPQSFFRTSDLCFSYTSNAFGGTDSIAMTVCDELGICDVFTFPIEIPSKVIEPGVNENFIFTDDFSYIGPYPDPNLWIEDQVFINRTLAYNPPSVGVATFDALDRTGSLYDINVSRVGDRLTSQPINMTAYDDDDDVYLKFYVQVRGLGFAPAFLDSMYVELKDDDGNWKLAEGGYNSFLVTTPLDTLREFEFKAIQIEDDDFFHDRFQFRFSARVSENDIGGLWHLDYVTLQANDTPDPVFPDISINERPTNILENYYSMPWRQFEANEANELRDTLVGKFFNHDNVNGENDVQSNAITFLELETNTPITSTAFDFNIDDNGNNLISQVLEIREADLNPIFNSYLADLEAINAGFEEKRIVEVGYSIFAGDGNRIKSNDTVKLNVIFDDYFAYDDGTAEVQIQIENGPGGEELAQKYTANVADTVTGIRLFFSHFNGDVSDQEFKWRLYDEFPGGDVEPIYESAVLNPFFVDTVRDTLQGFTTYRVEDEEGEPMGIPIAAGDFYISFIQVTPTPNGLLGIPLGLDRNNPLPDSTNLVRYEPSGGTFDLFSDVGALMMNPILGGTPFNSPTTEIRPLKNIMGIYPNPATDVLYVNLLEGYYEDYQVEIYNTIGQLVKTVQLNNQIDINELSSGLYLLKVNNVKTLEAFQQKLLIAK